MKVYTCTTFEGVWPIGTAAIVVGHDETDARRRLGEELLKSGLKKLRPEDRVVELDTSIAQAIVLCDGDY